MLSALYHWRLILAKERVIFVKEQFILANGYDISVIQLLILASEWVFLANE
jgi:hypothetical protein